MTHQETKDFKNNFYSVRNEFLQLWTVERVKNMTVHEYTNLNRSDSFCYWLEAKTYYVGSIWGGSAFKFGIYEKNKKDSVFNSRGRLSDENYAWMTKYGHTRTEAFEQVRRIILQIIEFSRAQRFSEIGQLDLGDAVKWKIAFLYSDFKLFTIYKKEKLVELAKKLNIPLGKSASFYELQRAVLATKPADKDFLNFYLEMLSLLEPVKNDVSYWLYSPAEQARLWEEFYKEGIMALGWDELDELDEYDSREEITAALRNAYGGTGSKKNDTSANDDFANKMKTGDIVIVKKGRKTVLGYGKVVSEYFLDVDASEYKHRRKMKWHKKGKWTLPDSMVLKTLTDITSYKSKVTPQFTYAERLVNIMEEKITLPAEGKSEILELLNYKKQIILQGPPGTGKTREAKNIASQMLGLASEKELEKNEQFKLVQFHPSYTYEDFVRGIVAKPSEDGKGILYEAEDKTLGLFAKTALTNFLESKSSPVIDFSSDFRRFVDHVIEEIDQKEKYMISENIYIYYVDDKRFKYKGDNWTAHPDGLNMNFSEIQTIITNNLSTRKEINKSEKLNALSRQHATYYQNLNENYKQFVLQNPVQQSPKPLKKYVLVIDEINRANLSSVLGELIYALEYRNESVESMYEIAGSKELILPPNLFIIGTMNTADRSVGHIDYAIRRRFAFVEILPKELEDDKEIYFNTDDFEQVSKLFNSNNISKEFNIKDVQIGHSYFIAKRSEAATEQERDQIFAMKMQFEVVPILEEYVKDGILINDFEGQKIEEYISSLKS